LLVARYVLANISGRVANDGGVDARVGDVLRKRIALINSTSVIIVAKIDGHGLVDASLLYIASVVGTRVLIVARGGGLRNVSALGGESIVGLLKDASVDGTSVLVVAIGSGDALRLRWAKIGGVDVSGGRVTLVGGTKAVGGYRQ